MIEAARAGFVLGFALILAIGAQNAFVLRQGIRREHVLPVVLTCAISDALLIAGGVAGIGALIEALPWLVPAFRWGGAAFLILYGAMSFYSAFKGEDALGTEGVPATSLKAALVTVLGLTFLNPHVYLDTVILLGSVSNTRFPDDSLAFAIGAMAASFVFFFTLGYGARLLSPVFANPRAWRILDVIVGLTMWSIAAGLILKG